jgi:hypothetical protein
MGRQFSAEEEQLGRSNVVMISYALWQRGFGGDAQILGKEIRVNGARGMIIGVLPEGFHFPRATERLAGNSNRKPDKALGKGSEIEFSLEKEIER